MKFIKVMTVAIDILLAITLGMEIKDRLARKKNMSNDTTVDDLEPETVE